MRVRERSCPDSLLLSCFLGCSFSGFSVSGETAQDLFSVDTTVTQNNATVSGVGVYGSFLLGAQVKYDIKKTALSDYKVTGSYRDKDFGIVSSV
jgi:hypothetical protein